MITVTHETKTVIDGSKDNETLWKLCRLGMETVREHSPDEAEEILDFAHRIFQSMEERKC